MIRYGTIAAIETALGMSRGIIITMVALRILRVIRIVAMLYVMHLVAVLMVMNISGHIRMVVAIMTRSTVVVMRREMAIIVRRYPHPVIGATIIIKNQRPAHEYRFDNIIRAINIRMSDDLHIR